MGRFRKHRSDPRTRVSSAAVGLALAASALSSSPAREVDREPDAHVVVTASRLGDRDAPIDDTAAHVTVFTREDIEASGARSVQDLLASAAGVVVYDQVGNDLQKTIDIRGFTGGSGCAIYLDGARINDPRNNAASLEAIPIDAVDRIEVTRGSAAALAGGGAEAGIVRIETRRGRESGGSLTAGVGAYGAARYGAEFEGKGRRLDWLVSGSFDRSDGFRRNAGGDLARISASAGLDLGEDRILRASLVASDLEYGAPGALSIDEFERDPYGNEYNLLDTSDAASRTATVTYRDRLSPTTSLAANVAWRDTRETSVTTGRAAELYGGFALASDGSSLGSTVEIARTTGSKSHSNRLVIGVEGLGGSTSASGWFTPPDDPGSYDPSFPDSSNRTDRTIFAVYAQDTWTPSEHWSLTAGLRWDRDRVAYLERAPDPTLRDATAFSKLSMRGGIVYRPRADIDLYVSYGEAFLPPTAEQLFAFPLFGSNPGLRPEDSRSNEFGLRARRDDLSLDVALFRVDTEDEIVFDPDATLGPFGANVNAGSARREGIEAAVRGRMGRAIDGFATYTLTDATLRSGADAGKTVPLVPRHRITAGLTLRAGRGWSLGVDALRVSSQVLDNDPSNARRRLEPYTVVNARLTWVVREDGVGPTLFAEVRNVFDRVYATRGIFAFDYAAGDSTVFLTPAPGRRLVAGVTWRF